MSTGDTLFAIWLGMGAAGTMILTFMRRDYGDGTDEIAGCIGVALGPLTLVYAIVAVVSRLRKNRKDRWEPPS